jgi:hypothetical protein
MQGRPEHVDDVEVLDNVHTEELSPMSLSVGTLIAVSIPRLNLSLNCPACFYIRPFSSSPRLPRSLVPRNLGVLVC